MARPLATRTLIRGPDQDSNLGYLAYSVSTLLLSYRATWSTQYTTYIQGLIPLSIVSTGLVRHFKPGHQRVTLKKCSPHGQTIMGNNMGVHSFLCCLYITRKKINLAKKINSQLQVPYPVSLIPFAKDALATKLFEKPSLIWNSPPAVLVT